MELITKEQIDKKIKEEILKGKIFVYPTDTIYGIGCNATNNKAVLKIREIKRSQKPFSVIAPSLEWIENNCELNNNSKKWLNKMPGPYTLILKLKNNQVISKEVNNANDTIGVRMPNNWFYGLIKELNIPFITTSVNITSNPFMVDINSIEEEIKQKVDYIINDGVLNGRPSTIVNLTKDEEDIIKR